ncbi:hypothetical protein Q1695_007110 [Nippostrongylus brasiliensis]|nr:hypothetical protein Q1695_007110 [Nippostrongylus brasiliensis]
MAVEVLLLLAVLLPVTVAASPFPPVIEDTCLLRPPRCNLVCAAGYLRSSSGCACACATDPCQAKLCAVGEHCTTVRGVARCLQNIDSSRSDCPRIIGGACALRCRSDADCAEKQICCSNGCGRECMQSVKLIPVRSTVNVQPVDAKAFHHQQHLIPSVGFPGAGMIIPATNVTISPVAFHIDTPVAGKELSQKSSKVGKCPAPGDENSCSTYSKCTADSDCADVEKCCSNACGSVCVDPLKATNCVHLVIAVKKLPNQTLDNGYFPKCDEYGKFAPIQCDERQCWCVDVNYGTEIAGSAVAVSMKRGDMCRDLRLCGVKCSNQCPHGLKMTVFGCPDPTCQCRSLCDGLLNPCPVGLPMTLPNGVTALCTSTNQCAHEHWCHKIGYNGLGFCCAGPNVPKREECPPVLPLKNARCSSKCSTDHDCINGVLSSLVADCPSSVEHSLVEKFSNCSSLCSSDENCAGMKRCCRVGCSTQCLYPVRTTPCFHMALTAELYQLRKVYRCDQAGKFERIQCDDNGCFCVDIDNGEELQGSRTISGQPQCKATVRCPEVACRTSCAYGFEQDANGCPTCRCRNPCVEVKCQQGSFCVMSTVNCFQMENCPPQARCVLNLCPRGEPFISKIGVVETCNSNDECPAGHWCHQVGFSSTGMCCPSPVHAIHSGTCPSTPLVLDNVITCRFDCRSDGDCRDTEKCCYDGCGLRCRVLSTSKIGSGEGVEAELMKPGTCPFFDERRCGERSPLNQCNSDDECAGVQKCCSDGCSKKCLYPESASACIQTKSALQMIGQPSKIHCRPDGSFEEVQCDDEFCWCVTQRGSEVEGTRTTGETVPNCRAPRKCPLPQCDHDVHCKFGLKKNTDGCDTCDCSSPCDGVVCPKNSMCVPMPVDCLSEQCPEVPRCVVNPCSSGLPWIDSATAQPVGCIENSDCVGSNVSTFCHLYKNDGGVCCTKQVFSSPPRHAVHIGECLQTKTLGAFCIQRSDEHECSVDVDCPPMRKCCSDGCVRRCTAPVLTTHCIHARLAALSIRDTDSSVFVPDCDSNGRYEPIQSHFGVKWCVDKDGREVQGTKSTQQPICSLPRSCPVRVCEKHCSFGFRTDNDGCSVCDCRAPCETIKCQAGFVCQMVLPRCYEKDCSPIPRCLPNVCPVGELLLTPGGGYLSECSEQVPCPAGYFCAQNGYEGRSFCCRGNHPAPSPISCPPTPLTLTAVDSSTCVAGCRRATDCPQSVCCFNGCGTSCQFETAKYFAVNSKPPFNDRPVVKVLTTPASASHPAVFPRPIASSAVHEVPISGTVESRYQPSAFASIRSHENKMLSVATPVAATGVDEVGAATVIDLTHSAPISAMQKVGVCPSVLLNPGCREECLMDSDCASFSKCCKGSCGTRCVQPTVTSSCLHRLNAFTREWPNMPPAVQCEPNGDFREIQCDLRSMQCWCVNSTGIEVIGTRLNSNVGMPTCSQPKICSVSCAQSSCDYGVRLDANGCPHDGVCSCKNPCDDFPCSSHKTCSLVTVECDRHPCPPIVKCITSPCESKNVVRDLYGNAFSCRSNDCPRGACMTAADEEVGICCQTENTAETPPHLRARSNCVLYREAVRKLQSHGVGDLHEPSCDQKTGLFLRIQCEPTGTCWCTDVESGRPVHGTRRQNAVGRNLCEGSRSCSTKCSPSLCPYGLALDQDGCPFPDCLCHSPCDKISCKGNEVCVLRIPQCSTKNCIAVPACERSPCNVGDRPVIEPRTKRQFTCREGGEICPTGFYCTGFDAEGTGLCCPGREPLFTKAKQHSCPHGDPFASSSDGTPLACSGKMNSCPSTHFCSTPTDEKVGICCVSKRHVCTLSPDRGPCSVVVPRYFYSPTNQTCTSFGYGGCAGNLNNFATKEHCESFCDGVATDPLAPYLDETDGLVETYELGFSLTGPQIPSILRKHTQRELTDFLTQRFSLPKSSIEDVVVLEDNTARFTVKDVHSSRIAKEISEAVNSGLELVLNGNSYRAEPHTWFAHQVAESSASSTAKTAFWVLLSAAMVFAGAVVAAFCGACAYLFRSAISKDEVSPRNNSPLDIVSNSIFNGGPRRRPPLRQDLAHFPSNATTRSVSSVPAIPTVSIDRSASYY